MRDIGKFFKKHAADIMALLFIAGLWACMVIMRQILIFMIPWIIG